MDRPLKRWGASPDDWRRLDALGLGTDLLPVVSNPIAEIAPKSTLKQLGKTPSLYDRERRVVGIGRWTEHQASDADLRRWTAEPDYGICIITRHARAIDIDVENRAVAQAIVRAIEAVLGTLPIRSRSDSGKCLVAFRLTGTFPKRRMKVEGGIVEFLGDGQQFIAHGTHPKGARYDWSPEQPSFPWITAEQLELVWASLEAQFAIETPHESKAPGEGRKGPDLDVEDPVADWLEAEGLVTSETRRGALVITCPWHEEHSSDTDGTTSTVWFRAGTNGHPQGHFRCQHAHCEHRNRQDFLAAIGYPDDRADDFKDLGPDPDAARAAEGGDEEAGGTAPRFEVIPAFLFTQRPAPQWIIKGLLPDADLAILYGESGSGKSFVMIDLAMAVARGMDWRGLKTRQGRVVYIAAEGGGGFRNRLLAYAHQHQVDLERVPFGVIHATPNFLEKGDIKALIAAIKAGGPVSLIITDTYAQVTPGANENSAEDMGKALRHARMITDETGGMMVLVHHAGKDSTKGARGWSGNHAAADAVLEVTRNGAQRALRTAKQKDGDDEAAWGFTLETVTIGMDEDGEPIDSCVVLEAEVAQKQEAKPAKKMGDWEKAVADTYAELAVGGDVLKSELILRVGDLFPEKGSVKFRRASARRALKNLSSMFNVDGEYVFEAQ